MWYGLSKKNVVKNEFERPGPQEIGKGQQQRANGGDRKPAFHCYQVFTNNPVESSSQALAHQSDTSTKIRSPRFCSIIDHLRPTGASHPSTGQEDTEDPAGESGSQREKRAPQTSPLPCASAATPVQAACQTAGNR